jgi:ribosomal protein S18 acetylase RimI-like enzyme
MMHMRIRPFQPSDESAVIDLWNRCGLDRPWNDPKKDIARKLLVRPDLFLVGLIDESVVATAMAGYEGHRGWINYLAVAPEQRRAGLARQIMAEAERLLREAGCPKINLQVRSTNREVIEFYQGIGFSVDEVVSMGKRLVHDDRAEGEQR